MKDQQLTETNNNQNINYRLGLIISLISGIISLILFPWAFYNQYYPLIEVEAAKGAAGCHKNVELFYPTLTDLGILSGVLFIVAALGFYKQETWSIWMALIANTLALKSSFWPMVPPMSNSMFPYYIVVFLPALLIFFILTVGVAKLSLTKLVASLIAGMAMITSFMNGIAATNRIDFIGPTENWIYIMTQRLNIIAGLIMGAVVVGIALVPEQEWVRITALITGLTELVVGLPVAITYSIAAGRPAMFFMGPIFTFAMLLILFVPTLYDMLIGKQSTVQNRQSTDKP